MQLRLVGREQAQRLGPLDRDVDSGQSVRGPFDPHLDLAQLAGVEPHRDGGAGSRMANLHDDRGKLRGRRRRGARIPRWPR